MLGFMPVEFLTDVQAAAYSRFTQPPSLAELERFLFRVLDALQATGYPVLDADADVARLSPYMRKHINVHGHYSFLLPELLDGGRPLAIRTPSLPRKTNPCRGWWELLALGP
jgi:hypothetical protein